MAKLIQSGYQHVSFYDIEPGRACNLHRAVSDFRRRDWLYRHRWRREYRKARAASTNWRGRRSDEEMIEDIEARHDEVAPYLFRDRRHFPQAGLT